MNEVRREQGAGAAADEPLNPTGPNESAEPVQAAVDPRPEPTEAESIEEERRAETEQWIKDQMAGRVAVSEVTAPKAEPEVGEAESDPALRQAQSTEDPAAEDPAEAKSADESADAKSAEESGDAASADEPAVAESGAEPAEAGETAEDQDAEGSAEAEDAAEPEEPPLPAYQRFDVTGTDPDVLAEAAEAARIAIENGECVVLPTDTVYGIGADAFDTDAVQRLLDAKERGRDMPPPVLIGDASLIRALGEDVPELVTPLTEKHWPGALTVIVKARESLRIDLGETRGTIGLRVPDYALTRDLLRQTGPMAVSSANLSGRPSALTCDQAIEYFGNKVAVYLDGGPVASPDGAPSSMVDFSQNDHGELLRSGAISVEVLRETLPEMEDLTAPPEDPEPTEAEAAADAEPTDAAETDAAETDAAETDAAETDAAETDAAPAEAGESTDPEPTDVGPAAEAAAASDESTTSEEPDSSEDIERLIEQHAGEPVPADDAVPADDPVPTDDQDATDDHAAPSPSEASPKT
ncbi:L-threonylcarbamoyladenylate synthase [Microlunatus sp. GCM10028923]|uniref:L-threonylcarbamoyladenylate synthase n=1 Tax=Microlunatus sp. GCM10028923 TaxID=3273400 RepID=UPI00360E5E40